MEKKLEVKYQGIVKDRMNENKVVYRSRPSSTWEEAHTKAERKARSVVRLRSGGKDSCM